MDAEGEHPKLLLYVPVRESQFGTLGLRIARLTSEAALLSALGPCQPWIRLHQEAMRDMHMPIGVDGSRSTPASPPLPPPRQSAEISVRRPGPRRPVRLRQTAASGPPAAPGPAMP